MDIEYFESLPLRGKVSVTQALLDSKSCGCGYVDFDLSNQYRNKYHNTKARNAKAKYRKRFRR